MPRVSVGTLRDRARNPAPGSAGARARALAADRAVIALSLVTVLAGVLRFARIAHQGFWFDEANTALLMHYSPGEMLRQLARTEETPPLYYCLAWIWTHVFGDTEAGLRSLSAVLGVGTVPVAFALGRRLISVRGGLVAAALVACNPLLIWYSQEARAYALLVLMSGLSLLAFLCAREEPTRRRMTLWALAAGLCLFTHYYALLAIVPQAVWLLVEHRRRRPALVAIAGLAVWGLALLPLALHQKQTGRGNWIAGAALSRRLRQVVPQFLTGFQLPAASVLVPLAGALALLGLALLVWRGEALIRRRAQLCAALALGGLALNLLIILAGIDDLLTRNLLALWFPAALVLVAGLSVPRAALLGALITLALCVIGVTSAIGVMVDRDFQRPDWRGVAQLLGTRPAVGSERAIFIQHYRDLLPLSLYVPGLRFERRAVRVRELDIVSFTSPPSGGFCWWGSACNLWPSAVQPYPLPGFRVLWVRRASQFTVQRFLAATPTRISPHELSRMLSTTRYPNDELLVQR
jgi:uncharacterized membrane protein